MEPPFLGAKRQGEGESAEMGVFLHPALSHEAGYALPQAGLPACRSTYLLGLPVNLKVYSGMFQLSSLLTVAGQRRTLTGLPVHLRHNILLYAK